MSSVFPIEQITKGSKLADWHPSGGNGQQHRPGQRIEEEDEMADDLGADIVAALQKYGPCSPANLAKRVGVDRPMVSKAIKPLIDAKKVKATGATISRMISLPGQKLPEDKAPRKKAASKKVQAKTAKPQPAAAMALARTPPPRVRSWHCHQRPGRARPAARRSEASARPRRRVAAPAVPGLHETILAGRVA